MKNFSFINPIPKRVFSINYKFILVFIYGVIFCTEMKAIPEDWPSSDGLNYLILKEEVSMQLSCKGSIQLSLDQNGLGLITPQMLLTDNYVSYSQFKVVINQTGTNVATCADIGKKLTVTVVDTTNGMMCWSNVVVEDKFKPSIICAADTVSCTNDPFTLDYSTFVIISDNCDTNVTSFYDITLELFNCSNARYSSVVHLRWTAIDDYGNSSTCLQDIYFKKSSVDSVVFPLNDTVYCPNADLTLTGVPTLFGDTVSHLCQLLVTHVDDSIIVCGGMMKIRRLWTVIDWCNSTMRSETQEILVSDTTQPVIVCPGNISIYSSFISCAANFTIPTFSASDACSPSNLLLLAVRLDSSYFLTPGQVVSLTSGIHSLNYIAIDPCGNADTCTSYVSVIDKITPSLICPPALVVSLDPQGHVLLTAEFLAGKGLVTDNCCLDTMLVRRMTPACGRPQDTAFSDIIDFCCDDIGDTVMIVLKATDCSGNMNFCMIQIFVQDKNPRTNQSCPRDTILSCDQDFRNVNITGNYLEFTTCLDTIYSIFSDSISLDSCSEGLITRTFFLVFPDGSTQSSCVQLINLVNNYVFDSSHVIYPGDTSIPVCINYDPDTIMSKPWLTVEACGSVYFSFQDLPIQMTPDSCEFFDRVWTTYAYCEQLFVNDTQRITLLSVDNSILIAPQDTIVANGRDSCSRFIDLELAVSTGCTGSLSITNSFNNGGADASGVYPVGTTEVIFTITDLCTSIQDTTIVVVLDLESPIISCLDISINMEPNDTLMFTARSLLNVYFDNCTVSDSILISFTLNNFIDTVRFITCADLLTLPDTFSFEIFVQDLAGNVDSCIAVVIVDDPSRYCATAILAGDVGGFIRTGKNSPMKGVTVDLIGLNKTFLTDDKGYYAFNDLIANKEFTITPSYNKDWLAGLTTHDIVKIQRHILNIEPFDHPHKWIAADMDKNGRVTSADIVWLRKLILGKEVSVPSNQSWRFINREYKFINLNYPLEEACEEKTLLKGFWKDTSISFDAIKVGDVSAINNIKTIEQRLRMSDIIIENGAFEYGEIFKVDIIVEKEFDMEGFQMSFDLDQHAIELYRIKEFINKPGGRYLEQDEYNCNGSQLTIALLTNGNDGSVKFQGKLMTLLFKAKKASTIKDVFAPGSLISNEIYPKDDVPIKMLFTYKVIQKEEVELGNWYVDPNPFKDRCYIEFNSTHHESITFSVYELTGKAILSRTIEINKGKNILMITSDELPGVGTYLYHIRHGDHAYNGKIVKIE